MVNIRLVCAVVALVLFLLAAFPRVTESSVRWEWLAVAVLVLGYLVL